MIWLDWLRPALGEATEIELLTELRRGEARLWVGDDAALVTQLAQEADGACIHIWLAGGTLAGVLALRPGIEAWARGAGCRSITVEGRPGWRRVLRPYGYLPSGCELKRTL